MEEDLKRGNYSFQSRNFKRFIIILTFGTLSISTFWLLTNYNQYDQNMMPPPGKAINKCNYGPNGPKIYCAAVTHYGNLATKALAVNKTWGRRCDKLIFVTGKKPKNSNATVPANLVELVHLNVNDTYKDLTAKSLAMLRYVDETTKPGDFDWFLKADDDTYVVMENLKWFLNDHCPNESLTYGFNFKTKKHHFHSGGGGYTISSSVVKKLGAAFRENSRFCEKVTGSEDVDVSKCLNKLNVTLGESIDSQGRERFHGINIRDHFSGNKKSNWIKSYAQHRPKYGPDCCSSTSISFHYVDENEMLIFEYLLYTLRLEKLT